MNKTNKSRCLLAQSCKLAGTDACNNVCPHFVSLHGMSGTGGRAAAANVPADYRLLTVANSPARASQPAVYKAVDAYVKTFERQFEADGDRIKSLYLFSESPGTGKTTTAAAILNSYIIEHYRGNVLRNRQPLQMPAYFLDANSWQTDFNNFNRPKVPDAIAEQASKRYYLAMEKAKKAPLAILDDIGVRDCSSAFRGDLHAIINHRVTQKLPTIYTSNLPIKYDGKKIEAYKPYDLVDVFGEERLADRIGDMCGLLKFTGESKRGRR